MENQLQTLTSSLTHHEIPGMDPKKEQDVPDVQQKIILQNFPLNTDGNSDTSSNSKTDLSDKTSVHLQSSVLPQPTTLDTKIQDTSPPTHTKSEAPEVDSSELRDLENKFKDLWEGAEKDKPSLDDLIDTKDIKGDIRYKENRIYTLQRYRDDVYQKPPRAEEFSAKGLEMHDTGNATPPLKHFLHKVTHKITHNFGFANTNPSADLEPVNVSHPSEQLPPKQEPQPQDHSAEYQSIDHEVPAVPRSSEQKLCLELDTMMAQHRREELLKKKIETICASDIVRGNQRLRDFYIAAYQRLQTFVQALNLISEGYLPMQDTWKDQVVRGWFGFLGYGCGLAVDVGALAFAPTVVVSWILQPLLGIQENLWNVFRENTKGLDIYRAATRVLRYSGETSKKEYFNKIVYGLTFALQQQLMMCSAEGQRTLLDCWFKGLCYNIVKGKLQKKNEAASFVKNLTHIQHIHNDTIELETGAHWKAHDLFRKAGLAYPTSPYNMGIFYETIPGYSEPEKYGYIYFQNITEALQYKQWLATDGRPIDAWRVASNPELTGPLELSRQNAHKAVDTITQLDSDRPPDLSSMLVLMQQRVQQLEQEVAELKRMSAPPPPPQ